MQLVQQRRLKCLTEEEDSVKSRLKRLLEDSGILKRLFRQRIAGRIPAAIQRPDHSVLLGEQTRVSETGLLGSVKF